MKRLMSRRSFLKTGAIALGATAICGFSKADEVGPLSGRKTLSKSILKEREMPHIIVKLWPGRSEEEKQQLSEAIVKTVVTYAKCDESSVSVAIEEIKPADWAEKVYKPDILNAPGKLYKKPGYSM